MLWRFQKTFCVKLKAAQRNSFKKVFVSEILGSVIVKKVL